MMHYTIYREGIQEQNHGSTPFTLLGTADDDSRNTSKLLDRVGPPILRFIEDNVVSMKSTNSLSTTLASTTSSE